MELCVACCPHALKFLQARLPHRLMEVQIPYAPLRFCLLAAWWLRKARKPLALSRSISHLLNYAMLIIFVHSSLRHPDYFFHSRHRLVSSWQDDVLRLPSRIFRLLGCQLFVVALCLSDHRGEVDVSILVERHFLADSAL